MGENSHRVASLDLLRGLAAYSVAVPHFFIYNAVGDKYFESVSVLAVEIFFVLSGYVLAPQILQCISGGRSINLLVFLVRRWMRTVPPYLVALVFISVMFNEFGSVDFLHYALYIQNLYHIAIERDYYPVAWSLSIEEWFYVTFPVVVFACSLLFKTKSLRFIGSIAIAYCALFIVARSFFGDPLHWGEQVRRVVAFRLDSIGYGFLLYFVTEKVWPGLMRRVRVEAVLAALLASAVLAICVTIYAGGDSHIAQNVFPYAAGMFGALCILSAIKLEKIFERRAWLGATGLFVGKLSYSVYLFHLIFVLLLKSNFGHSNLTIQVMAYVAVMTAFSTMFYYFFESPILAARPKYRGLRAMAYQPGPILNAENSV
ncbi:MAG TPA: acyltransferase [Xanthobacteraceae bacterium]|nr:acyltransferase [Xanthobacteraceae bacterium]